MATLTHPERVLYPHAHITKQELADYYIAVHEWMLPLVSKRLLTLVRCPQGQQAKGFFQKHLNDDSASHLFNKTIKEKSGSADYFYLKNVEGLLDIVQMSGLEIHCWGSHVDKVEKPDVVIFDLDPAENVQWSKVVAAAQFVRESLTAIDIVSFVKTTGGKGLHVVAPIKRNYSWDKLKSFAHDFVDAIVEINPAAYTATISKQKRDKKIFLDYLRNQRGATAIAPYSTRATPNATVATPITWEELAKGIKPLDFTVKTVPARLRNLKKDPWDGYFELTQKL